MKKLTIALEDEVYDGLCKVVGLRHISRFLSNLARPHVNRESLDDGYRAMAEDAEYEREATGWIEAVIADIEEAQ